MKKIYLLLLTNLFFLSLWAQGGKEIDSEWKHQINTVFQNLEMERVPHGVLLDYAMEFTDITGYGGELRDGNKVDMDIFNNIHKMLYGVDIELN